MYIAKCTYLRSDDMRYMGWGIFTEHPNGHLVFIIITNTYREARHYFSELPNLPWFPLDRFGVRLGWENA